MFVRRLPFHFVLYFCLSLQLAFSAGRDSDRAGAVRIYEQATKLNAELHGKSASSRTPQAYRQVLQKLEEVLIKDPHFDGCDDSLYLMGKLYQEMGERFKQPRYFQQASDTYARLVTQYPKSSFAADALMAAGEISLGPLQNAESAAADFQRVVSDYPASPQAKSARQQLGKLEKAELSNPPAAPPAPVTEPTGRPEAENPVPESDILSVTPLPTPEKAKVADKPDTHEKHPLPVPAATPTKRMDAPRPAKPTASGVNTLTRTLGLKTRRIVIDPGHGGHDTGTIGKNGLKEKDLALDVALRLRDLLRERLDAEVILTRDSDVFIPLEERTEIANRHKADLYISIHANSSRSTRVSGVETWVMNFARNQAERELATRENAASHRTIADLENLVRTIAKQEKREESKELARCLQKRLQAEMARMNPSSRGRGIKQAPFVVLAGAAMPAVLTELAFLSNPKDASALQKEKPRTAAAQALYQGIRDYVQTLSAESSMSLNNTRTAQQ